MAWSLPFFRTSSEAPKDMAIAGGAYEGSVQFDAAMATWQPGLQSADADILPEKEIMDARARDRWRNSPFISAGLRGKQNGIVGKEYRLMAEPILNALPSWFDEKKAAEFQEEVEAKFRAYANSPSNWADASGVRSFTGLVRLAVGVAGFGGEALFTAEWLGTKGRPYGTAILPVDTDRLGQRDGKPETATHRGGVHRNRFGAPVAYDIREEHPSDLGMGIQSFSWKTVNARKPWGRQMVLHLFDAERPDQTRGVSMVVSALRSSRMFDKFSDTQLQNAVARSSIMAYIESERPPNEVFEALGAGQHADAGGGRFAKFTSLNKEFLGAAIAYAKGARSSIVNGVKIPHFYPGTKLHMLDPSAEGAFGEAFSNSMLRHLAAAIGVSFEELSRDYSKSKYSTLRAALLHTMRELTHIKRVYADATANFVYRLWLEEAILSGKIDSIPSQCRSIEWLFGEGHLDALANASWLGAAKGSIEELKEDQAAVLRINNNITTLKQECAARGLDYDEVLKQRAREQRKLKELGLSLEGTSTSKSEAAIGKSPAQPQAMTEDDLEEWMAEQ